MAEEPSDIYHTERDDNYLRLVREEAEFWDRHTEDTFPPHAGPKLQEYFNERFTGDSNLDWYEVIPRYGEFKRGCVLGCGLEAVERRILALLPSIHLTFYDISGEALSRRLHQYESEFPGRVDVQQEDLNFARLPENAYDLIISHSAMHHIVNLEHVAYQANRALTADGVFFLRDFVAESRLQFSETKKRVFEAINYARGPRRESPLRFDWPDVANWTYSPFEAIRSGEILDVFRAYLQEVELRVAGAIVTLVMFARLPPSAPPEGRRILPRRLTRAVTKWRLAMAGKRLRKHLFDKQQLGDMLIIADRIVSETGCLRSALAFAVYRKRQS